MVSCMRKMELCDSGSKVITVTFDQNGQNAVSAEFGILAASLPNWRFRTDKDVI